MIGFRREIFLLYGHVISNADKIAIHILLDNYDIPEDVFDLLDAPLQEPLVFFCLVVISILGEIAHLNR